jgi:hypothetical protein
VAPTSGSVARSERARPRRDLRVAAVVLAAIAAAPACRRPRSADDTGIQPACTLTPASVEVGSVVAATYAWTVGRPLSLSGQDYEAFVHFVDENGTVLFTDDHRLDPPVGSWKKGATYRYTRTVVVPPLPFTGRLEVRLGLFSSTGQRLALTGTDRGLREFRVGELQVGPSSGRYRIVYRGGWHPPDAPAGDFFSQRRWTAREAWAGFRNRGKDVLVVIDAETSLDAFPRPPVVRLAAGEAAAQWTVDRAGRSLHKVRFPAASLGQGRWSELHLSLDQSFVPKKLGINEDQRELGLWVHRLFVGPVDEVPPAVAEGALFATTGPARPGQ